MAFNLRLGGIYTLHYGAWKTNYKIYAFILWGNPISPKVHALNLGAIQLNTVDRAKLVHTIVKLGKVPNASIYSGQLLYRIFLSYLKPQVGKCYRTYHTHLITHASLLNYGINKEEDFSEADLSVHHPQMYDQAKKDYLVKLLDMYNRRGVEVKSIRDTFAKIETNLSTQGQQKPIISGSDEDEEGTEEEE